MVLLRTQSILIQMDKNTALDKTFFERKIVNIFLPISFKICFGCSKDCIPFCLPVSSDDNIDPDQEILLE